MSKSKNNNESSSGDADSPSYWINNRGYPYVSDGEKMVAVHVLLAIVGGADPHVVFSDEMEVHHRLASGLKLNHPNNVQVVSCEEHRRLHRSDATRLSPEQVLFPEDDAPSAETAGEPPAHAD